MKFFLASAALCLAAALLVLAACSAPISGDFSPGATQRAAAAAAQAGDLPQGVGRLTGVNWFGFETGGHAPHGLWSRDYKSMLKQIWDLGFNCVRLPYSDAMLAASPNGIQINKDGVDAYTKIRGMNTDLEGLSSIQVMDKIIAEANRIGLKIILDDHSRAADGYMNETLWYTAGVSEEQWIANWVWVVNRYRSYPNVVAADIKNEPHGNLGQGMKPPATWGYDAPGYSHTDWKAAAEKCGQAIVAANPRMIIIVEGVEEYRGQTYWWGGNLQGVKDYPITAIPASNLVYSAHEYGPEVFNQAWFSDPAFPANMPAIWDKNFWYVQKQGISPLFFGEFGLKEASAADPGSTGYKWLNAFMQYVGKQSSWTFWCMNPNSGDTGGILADDWVTVNQAKYQLIKPYLAPRTVIVDESQKDLLGFSFAAVGAFGVIDQAAGTVSVGVPPGTGLGNLVATYTTTGAVVKVGTVVQASGMSANDFSQPVKYTVTAIDGSVRSYTVTVTVKASSSKDITAFSIPSLGVTAAIDQSAGSVSAEVPAGTNLKSLVAAFSCTGASVKVGPVLQTSGVSANDFSAPLSYVVSAQDGSTRSYLVTVKPKADIPAALKVGYAAGSSNPSSNTIGIVLHLNNAGSTSIRLADLKLRYYYTKDGTGGQNWSCDYAGGNVAPGAYGQVTAAVIGAFGGAAAAMADSYLETGFSAQAGDLAPGGQLDINLRVFNATWANYNQANDYSFGPAANGGEWTKVTAWLAGNKIWGVEP